MHPAGGTDPADLERFVQAQEPVYDSVLAELRRGRKSSHWMWFVFPQLRGLGRSAMADRYGIGSVEEARLYLAHSVLGSRLRECAGVVNGIEGRTIGQIFGSPDDMKFHSSMTLFHVASPSTEVFSRALEKYFGGNEDQRSLAILGK